MQKVNLLQSTNITLTKILITGGSGLVGKSLTQLLIKNNFEVVHLGRKANVQAPIKCYQWDIEKGEIDTAAFENVSVIVHLAGAGIADKRWTAARKQEILDSRIKSTQLLEKYIAQLNVKLDSFVSASAIGYYGFGNEGQVFDENSDGGSDFLANVTQAWENEVDQLSKITRVVKMRIGVVLTNLGGALPQMAMPVKFFAGSPLGSGQQMTSWIDLDDLCEMFLYAIKNSKMNGAYNAVAPLAVTTKQLTQRIAHVLNRPVWPINVPSFLLNILVGEMATVVLGSCHVLPRRFQHETDFIFKNADLDLCLKKYLLTKTPNSNLLL